MKIKEIHLSEFKRFTDLRIASIPPDAKLVFLIGPNGSGKTCLLEALNVWHQSMSGWGWHRDKQYYPKGAGNDFEPQNTISVEFHDFELVDRSALGARFYFRGAYRHDPDFTVESFAHQTDPTSRARIRKLIQADQTVAKNYERLVSRSVKGLYSGGKDQLSVPQLREELIGTIQQSLENVFGDLILEGPGDPFVDGSFFFSKGETSRFHYKNLSGGEKSVFDLVLDLVLMRDHFPDAIYCIDEPEAHMYDSLQGRLLTELYRLVPEKSQLWMATHSLGMMLQARQIAQRNPDSIAVIDFSDADFDSTCTLQPVPLNLALWRKFLGLVLGENRPPLGPSEIIICEGSPVGRKVKDFDSAVYSKVFGTSHPDTLFLSLGSASDIEKEFHVAVSFPRKALPDAKVVRLVDRDDKSPEEVAESRGKGIRVLERRHIESYLFADEVLRHLCANEEKPDAVERVLQCKKIALEESAAQGKPSDDMKSAAGRAYVAIKKELDLRQRGNTLDAFMRDTLAPLLTPDTNAYCELESHVFPPSR